MKNVWPKFLVFMTVLICVGFMIGVTVGKVFSREEEMFYRGIYAVCLIKTRDEVGCLNGIYDIRKVHAHRWDFPLWEWPLPEPTPKPLPTMQRQGG